MRRLMPLALLLASPAFAQLPRAQCGYGTALSALATAEREAARPPEGLIEGRARAGEILSALQSAAAALQGCACPRAAELAEDALRAVAAAPGATSAAAIGAAFEQARLRIGLTRERLGRQGCS
jgi:hypothetical protein